MTSEDTDPVQTSRRKVIAGIPVIGVSIFGARELSNWHDISGAGANPNEYVPEDCGSEKKALTQAVGSDGVKEVEIPAERHRRISVFSEFSVTDIESEYDGIKNIHKVDIKQRSDNPCDLAIIMYVSELGSDYPTAVDSVPINYKYSFPALSG